MALIDQRILIDAPPHVVWNYLSDPAKMPSWHAGYRSVSVLTTRQTGPDTRRRCTPARGGKDVIERITAWVDNLGYEYEVTEGGPYRTLQGRFRLQISPDGTTVQWTIFYKPKGLRGRIKDRLGGRQQVADMMATSLRQLRRRVDELGQRMDAENRAKVAIQGRLNADERAHYQRRHPAPPGAANGTPVQGEPAAPLAAPLPPAPEAGVPSFVAELTTTAEGLDDSHTVDTEPKPPAGLREAIASTVSSPGTPAPSPVLPESVAQFAPPLDIVPEPPQMVPPPAPPPEPELEHRRPTPARGIPSVRPTLPPAEPAAPVTPIPDKPAGEAPRVGLPPPTPPHDTGEVSIWEIFGVQRPSERDTEVLDDLIRTVRKKQTAELQVVRLPRTSRRLPVRQLGKALGLRLKFTLRGARVRLRRK